MANRQFRRRHLANLTRGRIIERLEEDQNVTSVPAELRIAHSIVSRAWRAFQTIGTALWAFSTGRLRATKTSDDRYRLKWTGNQKAQSRLPNVCYHVLPWAGGCIRWVPLKLTYQRCQFPWYQEHKNRTQHEWGRVLVTDTNWFNVTSDSVITHIRREQGISNHLFTITERFYFGDAGADMMLRSRPNCNKLKSASLFTGVQYCS